jgi:PAS domain S-box-containing protein
MKFLPDAISLKTALVGFFAVVTVLAVGLVGLLSFYSGRQAVNDVALQLRGEIVGRINEHVQEYLAFPQMINQTNARAIGQETGVAVDQQALVARFAEQVDLFPMVTSIYFGNASGGLANSGRDPLDDSRYVIITDGFRSGTFRKIALDSDARQGRELAVIPDFDARTRPWHARALAQGGPVYNDIYIIYTGQDMSLAASRPVYDRQGTFLGVVSVDLFLSHLSKFLQGLHIGSSGQAFIMERSGELVACSKNQVLMVGDDSSMSQRVHGVESEDPAVREAVRALMGRFEDLDRIEGDQYLDFDVHGQKHLLQAASLKVDPGIDWLVVVSMPETDFMAGIAAQNRITILLTLGVLVLALLSGTFMGRGIVRPIRLLDGATRKLTSGSHSEEIAEKTWFVEVRNLTRSFNQMSRKLFGSIQMLNYELAERRQAEEALLESEEMQRKLLQTVPDLIIRTDLEGTITFVNELAFPGLENLPEEGICGKSLFSFIAPHDLPLAVENARQRLEKNIGSQEYQFRFDDAVIDAEVNGAVIRDKKSRPMGMVYVIRDITERKQAEEALRHSENLYRTIFEGSRDGYVMVAPSGRIIDANMAFCDMLGYSIDELRQMDDFYSITPSYWIEWEAEEIWQNRLLGRGHSGVYEKEYIRRDGSVFPVELQSYAVKDADGNIQFLWGTARDVTGRNQARQALTESEQKYREILAAIEDGYYETDLIGDITFCNEAAPRMLGYTVKEYIGLNFKKICKQPLKVFRIFHQVHKSGRSRKAVPVQVVRKDGSIAYGELSVTPLQDHEGHIVGFRGVARDITGRKLAEEALRQSEMRARAQRSAIASLTLDKGVLEGDLPTSLERITETVAIIMNTARASIWTLSEDQSDLSCLTLFEAGSNQHSSGMVLKTATFPRYFEALLQDSRIFASEAQTDSRTSELSEGYLVPMGITSMLDAGILLEGRLAGVVCLEHVGTPRQWHSDEEAFVSTMAALVAQIMANDRRKQAEAEKDKLQAQLLQAQKMESVGILAGGVAHDFNNLLHAMRGNIELLLQGKPEDHPDERRLRNVTRSMDRAAQLVQQLLFFSRKAKSEKVHVDLNQEVKNVARILKRTVPKMISLDLRLDFLAWPLLADPVQIEQVLLNLANNAVDAMPEGGRLFFKTVNALLDENFVKAHPGSNSGRHVLLTVTDTGCGMDKAIVDHVFDPFFTTKEVGKGTGLGLASVYGIVKVHGGYIQCYSEPALGTTFRVYLPAVELGDMATVKPQQEAPLQGGSETIFVVDDEPEIRELTREALEMLGYSVKMAVNGEQALEIFQEQDSPIDLVLLDLNMPGMGGHKCLQELLRLDPQIKVVITSGYAANGQGKDTLASGAKGFIGKPYQLKELAAMVREVLDEKEAGTVPK